jgi:hypothetical protein
VTIIVTALVTLLAWQLRPPALERWVTANYRLTLCTLAGTAALVGLLSAVTPGGGGQVPITPALLGKAAQAADGSGAGYDYACHIYGAPRQLVCEGQGNSLTFLVSPAGQLQLEPGQ